MEFFDKLGKKASEAYKITADKTGKIAKETKMKLKIGELKTQINDIYEEIGKKVYEKHIREEEISIEQELEEKCTRIDVLSDEIDDLLKQCLDLKDKKQCPKCYAEMEKQAKFCPSCGEKQAEEPVRETEILEDLENAEIKEENETETKIIKEYLEEDLKNNQEQNEVEKDKSEKEELNLSKTVALESDVEIEEKTEQEENLEKTVAIESNVETEEKENK